MNERVLEHGVIGAAGLDEGKIEAACALALSAETSWPRDLSRGLGSDRQTQEPDWGEVLGPTRPRGGPNGLVLHRGRPICRWGDASRVDMTFSVTKSFLALLAGIAQGDGLFGSLDEPVRERVSDGGFDSPHNAGISWRHLFEQTSEWQGTLWGKPDQVDHFRALGAPGKQSGPPKGARRQLEAPGTYWEYNDVRVNRLSLCLLRLFGRPLPEVLADRVMSPIGGSRTWSWEPYRNAAVEIEGRPVMSVPGGGHWGGGLFISSEDLARVGRLVQQGGLWEGQRILPEGWTTAIRKPCRLNPVYGLLWWLNTGRGYVAEAPETSYFMVGAGANIVWIDDALELVAVLRWIDRERLGEIVAAFLDAWPRGAAGVSPGMHYHLEPSATGT